MSLLDRESPNKTRHIKKKLPDPSTEEAKAISSPDLKNKLKFKSSELIEQYKFKGEDSIVINKLEIKEIETEDNITKDIVLPEQKLMLEKNIENYFGNKIVFLDLIYFCGSYINRLMYEPMDLKIEKIRALELEYTRSKMNIFSNSEKNIIYGPIQDKIYYSDADVLLVEELYHLSGFFREHFNIDEILVITRGGILEKRESLYCKFWTKDRLKKLMDFKKNGDRSPELFSVVGQKERCKKCTRNRLIGNEYIEQNVNKL